MHKMRVMILLLAVFVGTWFLFLKDRCVYSSGLPSFLCEDHPLFGIFTMVEGIAIAGAASLVAWVLMNVFHNFFLGVTPERNNHAELFDGHEQIVDGLLWVTNESTLVVTEEIHTSNNQGIRLFEHIGITKCGRWFCLAVDVKHGRIIRRDLTPLADSVAKKRLEPHREAYKQHFGPVGIA